MMDTPVITLPQIIENVNSKALDDLIAIFEPSFASPPSGIFPMSVDALMIILVKEGSGRIGIDLREYDIKKDSLIVLQPKNYVNHVSTDSNDCRALTIVCSRKIVEEILPKLSDMLPLLMRHRTDPVVQLSEEDASDLYSYFKFIKHQLSAPRRPFTRLKVISLLQSALYEMMDIQSTQSQGAMQPRSRKEEIMAKFIIAVGENFRIERHVNFYADRLCISPKHLSAVVKSISGLTAGEWIDNYVIMEAKVLLKNTDKTIQEVSNDLNFKNQSFFGKYFKHLTGKTPTQYRRDPN